MHDRILELFRSGIQPLEISRILGKSNSWIYKVLTRNGIRLPRKPPPLKPHGQKRLSIDIAEIQRLYDSGMTWVEVGKKIGASMTTLRRVIDQHSLKSRRSGPPSGKDHPNWSGGRVVDKSGYILVNMPDHPDSNHAGYIREHRVVAEQMLGRRLTPEEVVHHKNDDRSDNRPENLQVFASNTDHLRETLKGKCPNWTAEGLQAMLDGAQRRREQAAIRRQQESCGPE